MEKGNKRGNLNLLVIILIVLLVVATIGIIITFINPEEGNELVRNENKVHNMMSEEQSTIQQVKNEVQQGPIDPVDDNPSAIVQTPTEGEVDEVISGTPTM